MILGLSWNHEVCNTPEVTLTPSTKQWALSTWYESVRVSSQCLAELSQDTSVRLYDKDSIDSSLNVQCSLVLCNHGAGAGTVEACIVSWTKPFRDLKGRIVALDDTHCIMYPSHFVKPVTSLSKCFMIVPSIGARVRKKEREHVKPWVRRLRDMHNVAADSGHSLGVDSDSLTCFICSYQSSTDDSCLFDDPDDWNIRRCAFCLRYYHRHCSQQLVDNMESFRLTTVVQTLGQLGVSRSSLPFCLLFLGFQLSHSKDPKVKFNSLLTHYSHDDSRVMVR